MTDHITVNGVVYTEADLIALMARAPSSPEPALPHWVTIALQDVARRLAAKHAA